MLNSAVAMVLIVVTGMAALLSWLATRIVRAHTIRAAMFDVPNQRSSHTAPTPRGGGAAIAAVTLLCVALAAFATWLPYHISIALLGGGALVSTVGWLDDRHNVNAAWRAAAHLCAGAWAIFWLGGIGYVRLGYLGTISGPVGNILAILAIAWMINLYNFMDGIDGLAAVEAIFAGAVGALLLFLGGSSGLAAVSASIAGAAAGFLVWNRMPARIFMGDVGSGFLGFIFAVLALAAHKTASIPAIVWVLLLLVFIADATITLIRRILRGEPWHTAHRLHAYQRLVQSGLTHAQVVARVALLNVLLAVFAVVVFLQPRFAWPMLLLGVAVVAVAYIAVERRLGMWKLPAQSGFGTPAAKPVQPR
jgi:Fuc2NAc and GlcNAc transferase